MRSHGAVVLPLVVQQVHISANSRCVLTHAGRRAHYQHTHGSAMSYTVPQPQGSTELWGWKFTELCRWHQSSLSEFIRAVCGSDKMPQSLSAFLKINWNSREMLSRVAVKGHESICRDVPTDGVVRHWIVLRLSCIIFTGFLFYAFSCKGPVCMGHNFPHFLENFQ